MCKQNKLGKMLLLMLLLILASCSGGNGGSSSSLNADDIWDQMAAERQKPLPVKTQGDDSEAIVTDLPFSKSTDPLSAKDIDGHRRTLLMAHNKYLSLMAALDAPLPEAETEESRQIQLRTKQLYISRLITLQINMTQAIDALADGDHALVEESRGLLAVMAQNIARMRSRLDTVQ